MVFLSAVGPLGCKLQYGAFRYQTHWGRLGGLHILTQRTQCKPQLTLIKNSKSHNCFPLQILLCSVLFITINSNNNDNNNNKATV